MTAVLSRPEVHQRPGFGAIWLRTAFHLAERSTCIRLQVGCVITSIDHRKVLAVGYNGNASGLHNGCDSETPGACGCLHAEENAVINLDCPREFPKFVYCTHVPCLMCAKRLIQVGGVHRVFYAHEYRKMDGAELLEKVGITVTKLPL